MAGTTVTQLSTAAPTPEVRAVFDFDLLWRMAHAQKQHLGMTAKDAAASSGVSESKFSKREPVSVANIAKLCDWLQLPMDLFLRRQMSDAQRARFDELVEIYASADDMERRLGGMMAGWPTRPSSD